MRLFLLPEFNTGEFGAAAVKNGLDGKVFTYSEKNYVFMKTVEINVSYLTVKYLNECTHIAVIRSRHGPHKLLGSSLPFLSRIGRKKVEIHNIYTGATMVKCFKNLQVNFSILHSYTFSIIHHYNL